MRSFIVLLIFVSCLPAPAEESKLPQSGAGAASHDTLRGSVTPHDPLAGAPATAARPPRPDNVQTLGGNGLLPYPANPVTPPQVQVVTSPLDRRLAGDFNHLTGRYENGEFANAAPFTIERASSTAADPDPVKSATLSVFGAGGGRFSTLLTADGCKAIGCITEEIPANKYFLASGYNVGQSVLHKGTSRPDQVALIANEGINRYIIDHLASRTPTGTIVYNLGRTGVLDAWMTQVGITDATLREEISKAVTYQWAYTNSATRISLIQALSTTRTAQR